MRLFDELGPLTRRAIAEAPHRMDIEGMLKQFRMHWVNLHRWVEGDKPAPSDEAVARFIEQRIVEIIPSWRPLSKARTLARSNRNRNR